MQTSPIPADRAAPPPMVASALRAAGLPVDAQPWQALRGGRTNRSWRFGPDTAPLVCKLFDPEAATPLFPNDLAAEETALRHLRGTGLAPDLVDVLDTPGGGCLIYRHVPGRTGNGHAADMAALLHRLHQVAPPAGLRTGARSARDILAAGDRMAADLDGPARDMLAARRPAATADIPFGPAVFLHGDLVPANVIAAPTGLCLIDWQCPCIGDATEDIATYLSPAMQQIYAGAPLPQAAVAAFLRACPDPDAARRYRQLADVYHWRMAAHCLWKARGGDADYAHAAQLELDRIAAG